MKITHIDAFRREEWNAFAARESSFALLQSWEWGEFKEKLGWKVFRIAAEEKERIIAGAQILIKAFPMKLGSMGYIPRGPIGDWLGEGVTLQLFSEVHRVARQHQAIFLKIEPPLFNDQGTCQMLKRHGFHASSYNGQPRATLIIDLSRDLEAIFKDIPKKTRYNIRHATKKGVIIHVGSDKDLDPFYDLMQVTSRRAKFPLRSRAYYEHQWKAFINNNLVILMAHHEDQVLAVRTVFCFGKHAAEFQSGSLGGNFANLHSNYLLVWEAIQWAKAQGCCTFDLWGIPDEIGLIASQGRKLPVSDRTDGLWGVYGFKSSFSKNVVFYIGAYDYVYRPVLYTLISNKLFNPNRVERIAVWMDRLKHT